MHVCATVVHAPCSGRFRPVVHAGGKVALVKDFFPIVATYGHVTEFGLCVPRTHTDASPCPHLLQIALDTRIDIVIRTILRIQFLYMIAGTPHHLVVVKPNQIASPVRSIHMGQQRRITGHRDQIAVTFHPSGKDGFTQCRVHIAAAHIVIGRIFPGIYGIIATFHDVKKSGVGIKLIGRHIPMHVEHVRLLEQRTVVPVHRIDKGNVRILCLQRIIEIGVTLHVTVGTVLISQFHIFQGKRFRMSGLRTFGCPLV